MKIFKHTVWIKVGIILFILFSLFEYRSNHLQKLFSAKEKVITIGVFSDSYWNVQNGYSYQILNDAIEVFQEKHPECKVEYVSGIMKNDYSEWLAEQILSGNAPDLFFVLGKDFTKLSEIGALKNLNSIIKEDADCDTDRFYQTSLKQGRHQNKQYGMPFECAPKLMFVNKSILDREHIAMPDHNWTWKNFYDICKKVTRDTDNNGTIDQFGVYGYSWKDAFSENDVQLFNDDGSECRLSSEKALQALNFLESIQELSDGHTVNAKDFDHGKVAFMPMLFSEYRAYKSYPLSIKKYSGFEWECVEMPKGPHGDNSSQLDTLMLAMNASTLQEALAWEFMKTLTMDPAIQSEIFDYSEGISVLREVIESDETNLVLYRSSGENVNMSTRVLSNVLDLAEVPATFNHYDKALELVDNAIQSVMNGDKNLSMDLIIRNREINKELAAYK